MAAADVGHLGAGLQAGFHAVERGNPACHQVERVAGPEEPLGPVKERGVVLVPAEAETGAKCLDHFRDRLELRDGDLECAGNEGRAAFDGQREGLFLAQAEAVVGRVVLHVAAGRLRRQPLAQIARIGLGPTGQVLGGGRLFGELLVQAELVADDHRGGVHDGAEVAHELAHEFIQSRFVDGHGRSP